MMWNVRFSDANGAVMLAGTTHSAGYGHCDARPSFEGRGLTGGTLKYLNSIDYGVIAIYCFVLVGIAFYLKRMASRSLEDYFLGGKQLPWWVLGISGMTNFLDMTGTMVIVSFLYLLGPRGIYVEFRGGAVLVLAFMMLWVGKWHYRSQVMTPAEWNIYRYGSTAGAKTARLIGVLNGTIFTVAMLAYLIKGAGTFLSMFLDFHFQIGGISIDSRPEVCAVAMVLLTTLYTLLSGFYGVVFVDLFQSGIIVVGVIIVAVMAAMKVAGYEGDLNQLAESVTGSPNWTSAVPHTHVPMPAGEYQEFQPLLLVAAFYFLRNMLGGLGTGADPRYFGARNERECGLLTFFWTWLMVFRWPMMMGFAILGLFLVNEKFPDKSVIPQAARLIRESPDTAAFRTEPVTDPQTGEIVMDIPKSRWEDLIAQLTVQPQNFPHLSAELEGLLGKHGDWKECAMLVGHEGIASPERILPAVILMDIPKGLRGLFVVVLVAAAMSTFSPTVNICVALLTRDIWQGFLRPKASNRELLFTSYVGGILLVVGGIWMAYYSKSINAIWDWIIMGLTAGAIIPGLLRLYWWRFNAAGSNIGTVVGLSVAVLQQLLYPKLGPVEKFSLVTLLSLIGTIIGTYLFPPTERKTLERFYRTTRPFGLWGPLKHILSPEERRSMEKEHRYDVAMLPFALAWQITLFMLPMTLLVRNWEASAVIGAIFVVSLLVLYKFWYKRLPPARSREVETAGLNE